MTEVAGTEEIDFDSCLDSTIQSLLRYADTYLSSTLFNTGMSIASDENDDTLFEESLQNIDRQIASVRQQDSDSVINLSSDDSGTTIVYEMPTDESSPQLSHTNTRSHKREHRTEPDNTTQDTSTSGDDDIVFVSESVIDRPLVVDLCSPVFTSRRRRNLVLDENVITLDDTPTAIVLPETSLPTIASDASVPTPAPPFHPFTPKRQRMTNLPFVVQKPTPPIDVNGGLSCPVCLEDLKGRQPHSTVCGHLYCKVCIFQVLSQTKKCAMCKKALKKKDIHPIYM